MPPEQFRGDEVDERVDVFALGAFLYQTITGVGPYEGEEQFTVLDRIARGATRPIESREPEVPPDLAAITRKAMAPARADRYATAKELAADLKRFQTGQLVNAHVYSRRVLFARWLARNRRAVGTAAAFVVALGAIGVAGVRGVVRERDRAEGERQKSEARAQELTLVQARSSLDRDPTASLAWLKTATFDASSRDEALSIAADAQARGVARTVLDAAGFGELSSAVLSPDGARVYAGPEQPGLLEWDLAHGNRLRLLPTRATLIDLVPTADGTHAIAGSLEGDVVDLDLTTSAVRVFAGHRGKSLVAVPRAGHAVASCGDDGSVRVWDLTTGDGRVVGALGGACVGVDFAPDARSIVSAGSDGTLRLWDLAAATSRVLPAKADGGSPIAWSPDGATLVFAGAAEWQALDVASGRVRPLAGSGHVNSYAFLPGAASWVGGDMDGAIHVWNLAGGDTRTLLGHTTSVHQIDPRDATSFLSCGDDEVTRLWDLRTGAARVLRGHAGLKACRLAHDGRAALTSGNDGMIRVWDLPEDDGQRVFAGHTADVYAVAFSPDGATLATGSDDHVVRVWDVATGRSRALDGHKGVVEGVAFLDATRVASSSDDATLRVWNLVDGSSFALPHTMRVLEVLPTRDGKAVVTSCTDGIARVWNIATRAAVELRGDTAATDWVALSPDETQVATGSDDGTVRVWDRRTGSQLLVIDAGTKRITGVEFAAGGALLASSGGDGVVRIWDARTGALVRALRGHTDRIRFLAVSPDGARLVTASNDHTVRIWEVATGASRVLAGHAAEVRRAELSPDGRRVVSSSYDRTTRVWDAETGRLLQLTRSDAPVMRSAFSPDGALVASVGFDKMLHVARVDPSRFLPADAAGFRAWLDARTSATARAGGQVVSVAP
jgi:WD40 repeat protein